MVLYRKNSFPDVVFFTHHTYSRAPVNVIHDTVLELFFFRDVNNDNNNKNDAYWVDNPLHNRRRLGTGKYCN